MQKARPGCPENGTQLSGRQGGRWDQRDGARASSAPRRRPAGGLSRAAPSSCFSRSEDGADSLLQLSASHCGARPGLSASQEEPSRRSGLKPETLRTCGVRFQRRGARECPPHVLLLGLLPASRSVLAGGEPPPPLAATGPRTWPVTPRCIPNGPFSALPAPARAPDLNPAHRARSLFSVLHPQRKVTLGAAPG